MGSAHDRREEVQVGMVDKFKNLGIASVRRNEAIDGIGPHGMLDGVVKSGKGVWILSLRARNGYGELAQESRFNSLREFLGGAGFRIGGLAFARAREDESMRGSQLGERRPTDIALSRPGADAGRLVEFS